MVNADILAKGNTFQEKQKKKEHRKLKKNHNNLFLFCWAVWLVILFYPIVFKQAITNSPHTQQDCNQSCKAIESITIFIVKSLFCWCLGICATDGQYLSAFQGPPKWFSGLLVCSLIMPQKPPLFQLVSLKKENNNNNKKRSLKDKFRKQNKNPPTHKYK